MKRLLLLLPIAFLGFTAAATAAPAPVVSAPLEETGRALGLLRLLSDEGPAIARLRLDGSEGTFGQVFLTMNADQTIRGRARTDYGYASVRGTWSMGERGLGTMNLAIVNDRAAVLVEAKFAMTGIVGEWIVVPRESRPSRE